MTAAKTATRHAGDHPAIDPAKLAGVFAVIAFLGGLAQINPIWLYGPFKAAAVSTASQPDWDMGWVEGTLRLAPPLRLRLFGFTISELFWPGVVLPGITFGLLYLWAFLERRVTGDTAEHHLLDRPWDRPVRTAIGISALTFYVVLFLAGSQDVLAHQLVIPLQTLTNILRIAPIRAAGAGCAAELEGLQGPRRWRHAGGGERADQAPDGTGGELARAARRQRGAGLPKDPAPEGGRARSTGIALVFMAIRALARRWRPSSRPADDG